MNEEIIKKAGKAILLFLLIVVVVNVLLPLFCKKPDKEYAENLRKTEFTAETTGTEKICCIDDNEEALLWRLRMIGTAKESIVLSTFDLRADEMVLKFWRLWTMLHQRVKNPAADRWNLPAALSGTEQ